MTAEQASDDTILAAVEETFRAEQHRVVASVIRLTHDWDLAQDCAQEAFGRALQRWPADGVPSRPGAWLTTVARNRALDTLRRRGREQAVLARCAQAASELPAAADTGGVGFPDDRLALVFTCCHPRCPWKGR